jgi:hypothetical protein
MRKASLFLIAAVALGVLASGAWATVTYKYDVDPGPGAVLPDVDGQAYGWSDSTNPGSWYANIFKVAEDAGFALTKVQVYNYQSPYNMEVNVWDVTSGVPGTSLAADAVTVNTGWNTFDFSSFGLTFAKDVQFAVGFKALAGEKGPYAAYDNTGRDGTLSYRNRKGSAGWVAFSPDDNGYADGNLMVRAQGEKAPEPASLVLLGCAAGAGAWVRKRKASKSK